MGDTRKIGYRSGLFAIFDGTIAYITSALQAGDVGREEMNGNTLAANDA